MEVIAYTDDAAFDGLESDWNALLARAATDRIFYTWEWQKTWWHAYRPGELLVLVCRDGDVLTGIAPLFITEFRQSPIGTDHRLRRCNRLS